MGQAESKEVNTQKVSQIIDNVANNNFVTNVDVQNITNILNESVTKSLFVDKSACEQAYSNINMVEIGNVDLGVNCNFNVQQEIQQNIKMLCYQVNELNTGKINEINAHMRNDMKQALQNSSNTQMENLLKSMQKMDSVKQTLPNLDVANLLGKLTGAKQSGMSEQEISNTIKNEIVNEISNNISNNITNNVTNRMVSETTVENVKKCMQNTVNNNVLKVAGIRIAKCSNDRGIDIRQGIQSYVVSECIQTTKAVEKIFNDLGLSIKTETSTESKTTTDSKTTSGSTSEQSSTQTTDISQIFKNLFGSTVAMTAFCLICCVFIICCSIIASAVMYYSTRRK